MSFEWIYTDKKKQIEARRVDVADLGRSVLRPYTFMAEPIGAAWISGGEAVGGDGGELPGAELVEIFFSCV